MTARIAYIGLGAMGAPMTKRLAAANPDRVWCYDADPRVSQRVASESGAKAARDIAELAAHCDFIVSCVPDDAAVREVYLGAGGVASGARPGTITIDCSTVSPNVSREVYAGLKRGGASHLDASMLGSVRQANEGAISFVVGGDDDAFEKARPVLAAVGQMIRHVGASGAGNQMKLVHQVLVAGHAVAVAEALALCLASGTDIEAFYEIVTKGTGMAYSRFFENRVPRIRESDYSPLFMLKFMAKDARLARAMAPELAGRLPLLDAVIATIEEGEAAGWGGDDFSATMKVLERRTGRGARK
ncbi:MAG TPA: NAD(P)-dependent oxidoreductase [Alphaproteobacteria bacterium]|nr:NAD(P)-dependent oxidoreductase [Alphaproteobacteria bacterium]